MMVLFKTAIEAWEFMKGVHAAAMMVIVVYLVNIISRVCMEAPLSCQTLLNCKFVSHLLAGVILVNTFFLVNTLFQLSNLTNGTRVAY